MGELSRLSELTRFAELTRFLYVLSITLTFRLHAKRVLAGTEIAHTSHVIAFCRVGSAKRAENHTYACFNFDYMYQI